MPIGNYQDYWKKAKEKFPAEILKAQQKAEKRILDLTTERQASVRKIATLKAAKKKTTDEDQNVRECDKTILEIRAAQVALKKKREKTGLEPACKDVDLALKAMEARIVKGKIQSSDKAWTDARVKYQSALTAFKIAKNKNASHMDALQKLLAGTLNAPVTTCLQSGAKILLDATKSISTDIEVRVKAILSKVQ